VYRDIKQENIGFDVRGDVKVFDFGLSRVVSESMKARDAKTGEIEYGYNLTPRTGSVPYMAPEIMLGRPYDGQCDVFSFAILLWEIFNLRPAFQYMDRHEYTERVVRNGERLSFPIRSSIVPASIKELIKDSWDRKPTHRPVMAKVAKRIRNELNLMSDGDDAILRRSIHMNNRSNHSFRIEVLKQRSNDTLIRRSSSSNLLRRSSSSFRDTNHGSIALSQSKARSSSRLDLHYSGPSMRNGIES
jgi:serine/threonine protein kinase